MSKKIVYFILSFMFIFTSFAKAEDDLYLSLNGDKFTYEELTSGFENTILMLWTSGCFYCRKQLDEYNKSSCNQFKNAQIYYVNLGESKSHVDSFAKRSNLNSCISNNIILDKKGSLAYKYKVFGVPTYLFFKNGEYRYQAHYIDQDLIDKIFSKDK